MFFSGCVLYPFNTEDILLEYISNIGNNMLPDPTANGKKFTYFFDNRLKLSKRKRLKKALC